ncbi:glutaminase [Sphingopyxis lindanitolerans]|uniref:Glutaminase n=1 Tax=Sphingopyxis lindanitolerans TaxID=2054227 RepID=A0A2S8B9I9_9SPHN|nr:glutaminase [Sphingopyxis lindanitolerans]PQM28973.1 glutaminase [Sphingopyxis lindanitolerans]
MIADLARCVAEAYEVALPHRGKGKVADYIPALATVDPNRFGFALALPDGTVHTAGDVDIPFSIQSVSKVFTLALALRRLGSSLWTSVGREPSGSAFNSIVQLESENGIPRNPLINAGAIATTDRLIDGRGDEATVAEILDFLRARAGDDSIAIDAEVAASESETGARNRSLGYFMKGFGNLHHPVEEALGVYFRQCAIAMSCRQLARAGLFLAMEGRDPITGEQLIKPHRARRINAIMMLCGHYDNSGEFAFRVGLPGKSGVGGGILCIAPGQGSIAVWSPGLTEAGTSLVGAVALEHFAYAAGWSVFD